MIDFADFLKFVRENDVAGIVNPLSDLDEISIQDLKILYNEYKYQEGKPKVIVDPDLESRYP